MPLCSEVSVSCRDLILTRVQRRKRALSLKLPYNLTLRWRHWPFPRLTPVWGCSMFLRVWTPNAQSVATVPTNCTGAIMEMTYMCRINIVKTSHLQIDIEPSTLQAKERFKICEPRATELSWPQCTLQFWMVGRRARVTNETGKAVCLEGPQKDVPW